MYNVTSAFKTAVYSQNPQSKLLVKVDESTILTGEDIAGEAGVEVVEAVNNEEELTIGVCPSSTFKTTLINDHGLLSGYDFSECKVYLGAKVSSVENPLGWGLITALAYGTSEQVIFVCSKTAPYVKVNGTAPATQPPMPVYAAVTYGSTIYFIGDGGTVWDATWDAANSDLVPVSESTKWNDLATQTWDELEVAGVTWSSFISETAFSPFMLRKFAGWAKQGLGACYNSEVLYIFGETIDKYEYVPLGVFICDKPKKRQLSRITLEASDRMTKFDIDATSWWNALTYPTTLGNILTSLCAYCGVPKATTTFTNSTVSFAESPIEFSEVTCREVLAWIAEAACSYARMTRDGELELAWWGTQTVTIPMTQYFDIDVAEYEVARLDKLQVKGVEDDIGVILGSGTNAYVILDNPFLYGADDTAIRTKATPIYNALIAYPKFNPINARAVCNWALQAGDVISITYKGQSYRLPIYRQTIKWNSSARATYESTGSVSRPVNSAVNRRTWNAKRQTHELVTDVSGLKSRVTSAEGNVSSLTQTVSGISSEVESAEGSISALTQTVNSISLSVTNNGDTSTIALTKNGVTVSSGNISFTGYVTFAALQTSGATIINGDNIITGTISADRIGANNGQYISFLHPIYMPYGKGQIENLTSLTFSVNSFSQSIGYIQLLSITNPLDIYGMYGINLFTDASGSEVKINGNIALHAGNIASYLPSTVTSIQRLAYNGNMALQVNNGYWIYIGADSFTTQNVSIGTSNSTIHLTGSVYVNNRLIS